MHNQQVFLMHFLEQHNWVWARGRPMGQAQINVENGVPYIFSLLIKSVFHYTYFHLVNFLHCACITVYDGHFWRRNELRKVHYMSKERFVPAVKSNICWSFGVGHEEAWRWYIETTSASSRQKCRDAVALWVPPCVGLYFEKGLSPRIK